jgi:hypothetical protein
MIGITLAGTTLTGPYKLVRFASSGDDKNWLLIKGRGTPSDLGAAGADRSPTAGSAPAGLARKRGAKKPERKPRSPQA